MMNMIIIIVRLTEREIKKKKVKTKIREGN